MAGIREVDGRIVSRRKVSPLGEEESGGFTLFAPRYSPWAHTGGAQFMLMATTTQVAEFYLSLTFRAMACSFPSPRGEEAARGSALGGSGRGGGRPGRGEPERRPGGGAGPGRPHPETTCPGQEE